MGAGGRRQAAAENMGKVNAAFLDHCAVLDDTSATTAASRAGPGVFNKTGAAVFLFQSGTDPVLQIEQVGFDSLSAARRHGDPLKQTANG
jgi:hypothetical protein